VTNDPDRQTETAPEDEAFLAAARRTADRLRRQPFVLGLLAVLAAALLFLLGIRVGETIYRAFDGDGMMAVAFGATLVTGLVGIIAAGVRLDRRRRRRGADTHRPGGTP
jgi:hypothetical protein